MFPIVCLNRLLKQREETKNQNVAASRSDGVADATGKPQKVKMRQSHKPRMRSKGNRRSNGSVVNRVFESSGPEGKVRGNPQQIIDKYQALSRDALLAGDRVLAENHAQHAEHFIRMLSEATREMEARRMAQQQSAEKANGANGRNMNQHSEVKRPPPSPANP